MFKLLRKSVLLLGLLFPSFSYAVESDILEKWQCGELTLISFIPPDTKPKPNMTYSAYIITGLGEEYDGIFKMNVSDRYFYFDHQNETYQKKIAISPFTSKFYAGLYFQNPNGKIYESRLTLPNCEKIQ